VRASELATLVGGVLHGSDTDFEGVVPLSKLGEGLAAYADRTPESVSGGVLIAAEPVTGAPATVVVGDPKRAFIVLLNHLFPERHEVTEGAYVHPSANVDASAVLYPTAYVGADVTIGANSVLFPGAVVLAGTVVGARCRIGPGAVVGFEGFSLHRQADGYLRVPQVGRVVLRDGVCIGANSCVDRAFLEETVIGAGSHLDNLVQVGHNCVIGENVVIAGQAGLSGSVRLGADSVVGGQVGIADHADIGARTLLAARAGVAGDLEGGQAYLGAPAEPARLGKKIWIALRELPDLLKRVRRLERRLDRDDRSVS